VRCPGEGPRLRDWARGHVEEEDGREAADYPAGGAEGTRRRAEERVASLDGEEQSSGKREIPYSSLLREDKAEGWRTWRRHCMAGAWRWRGGMWRWCGGVATRGERGDEATRPLG
jgi:hypothetical protein